MRKNRNKKNLLFAENESFEFNKIADTVTKISSPGSLEFKHS